MTLIKAENLAQMGQQIDTSFASLGARAAQSFGGALSAGFAALGQGPITFGNFFKSMGNSILSGLGGIFTEMGTQLLVYGAIMSGLLPFLANPFTSGPAAIAAGLALIAVGGVLGAIATRNSGGGRGHGGGQSFRAPRGGDITQRTVLGPRAAPVAGQQAPTGRTGTPPTPTFVNQTFNVMGNTPEVQRFISDVTKSAARRGLPVGATG
jgi:hypothetical protein